MGRFDVIIVGGGPAGLSAALALGRCRRTVVVCDEGRPRNAAALRSHGFFTRDGESTSSLLEAGRQQLAPYAVTLIDARATTARMEDGRFVVGLQSTQEVVGRKLILATGIVDTVLAIEGFESLYGTSVFPCPICDAWDVRDSPLGAYARGTGAATFALGLKTWSHDVVLFTDGNDADISEDDLQLLARHAIPVRVDRIRRLEGVDGRLQQVVFEGGDVVPRRALFFNAPTKASSDLAAQLGCDLMNDGVVKTDSAGRTAIPGLYVAGDASPDMNFVAVAAAEGLKAGCAINKELRLEDYA